MEIKYKIPSLIFFSIISVKLCSAQNTLPDAKVISPVPTTVIPIPANAYSIPRTIITAHTTVSPIQTTTHLASVISSPSSTTIAIPITKRMEPAKLTESSDTVKGKNIGKPKRDFK